MSDRREPRPDLTLTEAEARRALERAAWNEAHKDSLTVAELTRVAEEAGYSREYLESAINEILEERALTKKQAAPQHVERESRPSARPGIFQRLHRWLQPVKTGLAGAVIGAMARRFAGFATAGITDGVLFMVGLVFAVIAMLAYHHRQKGRQLDFQIQTASIWIGFMLGWALTHGALEPEVGRGILTFWFLTGSLGGAIVHFRGIRGAPSGDETPGPA